DNSRGGRRIGGSAHLPAHRQAPETYVARPVSRLEANHEPSGSGTEIRRYWDILKSHAWLIVGVWVLIFGGVAIGTWLQTPLYRATGTLEIRNQGTEVVPLEAVFQAARIPDQHLSTQYG